MEMAIEALSYPDKLLPESHHWLAPEMGQHCIKATHLLGSEELNVQNQTHFEVFICQLLEYQILKDVNK